MMVRAAGFFRLILLCLAETIVAASEVQYIVKPSQRQNCIDQYSSAACVDNALTLSQFVNSSSEFLTNDTGLIFCSENFRSESELVVPMHIELLQVTCQGLEAWRSSCGEDHHDNASLN